MCSCSLKVYSMLDCINRKVASMVREAIVLVYSALVKTHADY